MKRILVITATLGNRDTLLRTIESVKIIGGKDVQHVVVAPPGKIPKLKEAFGNDLIYETEPDNNKGIYAALNHGFNKYAHDYEYMTFINDDDYWLPNYRLLIDYILQHKDCDFVYAKTKYVDEHNICLGSQTSCSRFNNFIPLLYSNIILLTQQATILRSSLFFEVGGFDESYKLVADSKFWALLSLKKIRYKYFDKYCAAYTIQDGQLSSDHNTQHIEHKRFLSELPKSSSCKTKWAKLYYRISNIGIYTKRLLIRKRILNPFMGGLKFVNLIICILPWKLKRWCLVNLYGYDIDKTAKIGLSYIFPDYLIMGRNSRIGHLNVAINLHLVHMFDDSSISREVWITGYPINKKDFFSDNKNRFPALILHKDSALTKKHLVDCTDTITIGAYTSVGGYSTQILTHSTSLAKNDQSCAPVTIGHHCFIGTRSVILPGTKLPDQSVLGACSLLNKYFSEEQSLYAGVPAKLIKKVNMEDAFFTRKARRK